jgi:hypothetical protein
MIHQCGICGSKSKLDTKFRISLLDAFGFVILMAICIVPVWLVSFIVMTVVTMIDPTSFPEGGILHKLTTTVIFCLYFYKFGGKVARFMALFVDYNFSIKSYCKKCGTVFWDCELPTNEKRPNV